jgi:hypothetical protein
VVSASWPAAPTNLAYSYDADTDKATLTWSGGATVNVYSNAGAGAIDYDTPEASGVSSPWTSAALTGPGTFRYGVRADNGSYEEVNLEYVEFELDSGEDLVSRPNSPYRVTVTPAAGGTFLVQAWLDPRRPAIHGTQAAAATGGRAYHDNGTGTMDWVTPIATVAVGVGPGLVYQAAYTTGAYGHGTTVLFGARAAASAVVEDNEKTVSAVADAEAPPAPASLAVTAAGDPWGG